MFSAVIRSDKQLKNNKCLEHCFKEAFKVFPTILVLAILQSQYCPNWAIWQLYPHSTKKESPLQDKIVCFLNSYVVLLSMS